MLTVKAMIMNEDDKESVVKPGSLPGKGEKVDPEKGNEINAPQPEVRIVDDKLIGDDRDMQDAIDRTNTQDEELATDANY